MRSQVLPGLGIFFLIAQPAFAQNLGVLSTEQQPENLSSPGDLLNELGDEATADRSESDDLDIREYRGRGGHRGGGRRGGHRGGHYRGRGHRHPHRHHHHHRHHRRGWYGSCCYYLADGTYYCPPYCYGHYGYNSSINRTSNANDQNEASISLANIPVACFASDTQGNWYVDTGSLENANAAQERVNHECSVGSSSCNQNLGCTITELTSTEDSTPTGTSGAGQ